LLRINRDSVKNAGASEGGAAQRTKTPWGSKKTSADAEPAAQPSAAPAEKAEEEHGDVAEDEKEEGEV
jgi:hypothetical protein